MQKNKVLATRSSKLAIKQSDIVIAKMLAVEPDISINILPLVSSGDKNLTDTIEKIGGKGVFVKEVEAALLDSEADLAVHSLKDMPSEITPGLSLSGFITREDPRDCLVSHKHRSFESLPKGAVIGTSSIRRTSQLLYYRPDLEIVPIRGNINTRISRMHSEDLDGIILAAAGLKRLNLENIISEYFDTDFFIPAPCQGTIVIQSRAYDTELQSIIDKVNCENSKLVSLVERCVNNALGGSCHSPIGCFAKVSEKQLNLIVGIFSRDGKQRIVEKKVYDLTQLSFGDVTEFAGSILDNGGRDILKL